MAVCALVRIQALGLPSWAAELWGANERNLWLVPGTLQTLTVGVALLAFVVLISTVPQLVGAERTHLPGPEIKSEQ